MSYRVEYASCAVPKVQPPRRKLRLAGLVFAFFVLFCITLNICYPRGREVMMELFLAGGGEELLAAVSNFSQGLGDGLPLSTAVQTFCREITGGG